MLLLGAYFARVVFYRVSAGMDSTGRRLSWNFFIKDDEEVDGRGEVGWNDVRLGET